MHRRVLLLAGALALTLSASGCSALRVSTAEGDSQPVNVGINDGSGDNESSAPDAARIPDGMSEVTVNLGTTCPVEMRLAMDSEWNDDAAYDGYQLYTRDNDAIITANCYEPSDESAQAVIDSAKKRTFSEAGSTNLGEKNGTLPGGSYWTYHGHLAPTEMMAIDGAETTIYGAVAGVADNGRLFKVTVEMITKSSDADMESLYEQMLPTVTIDGQELESPALS